MSQSWSEGDEPYYNIQNTHQCDTETVLWIISYTTTLNKCKDPSTPKPTSEFQWLKSNLSISTNTRQKFITLLGKYRILGENIQLSRDWKKQTTSKSSLKELPRHRCWFLKPPASRLCKAVAMKEAVHSAAAASESNVLQFSRRVMSSDFYVSSSCIRVSYELLLCRATERDSHHIEF